MMRYTSAGLVWAGVAVKATPRSASWIVGSPSRKTCNGRVVRNSDTFVKVERRGDIYGCHFGYLRTYRRRPNLREYDGPSEEIDRKSTRLNSSHGYISYAVFCLKKKKIRS